MKTFYIGAFVALSILSSACSKEQAPVGPNSSAEGSETTKGSDLELAFKAEIQPWEEDESLRALSWNIADPTASTEALAPKVRYTQEEFNGEYTPSEVLTDLLNGRAPQYYIGQNRISPQYTEVSIKLRRPHKNAQGSPQPKGAKQYHYTVWNGRNYNSGIQEGKGKVEVSTSTDGKQTMFIYAPLAQQSNSTTNRLLFDGDWYVAITLGGAAGGYNPLEGMNQYYGPYANGTIESIYSGTTTSPLNAYRQFGTDKNKFIGGWYPVLTEPNREHFPTQNEYGQYFGLSGTQNPTSAQSLRKGVGLREQVATNSTIKRHFPMMSSFYPIVASKRNQHSATGINSNNYGEANGIIIKPRGTIVAFKFKNSTGHSIKLDELIGNHGGTFEGYQASKLPNGGIVLDGGLRTYKAISYQGFYNAGYAGTAEFGGFPEAKMRAGEPIPFVGMTMGPEEFPLISSTGGQGITLAPGETTTGRFYLWFTADQGAEFKVRLKYTAEGESTSKLSKPQKVNPAKNHIFEEGKVYGALVEVKPE